MKKIFETDNGEIILESKNNAIKISQGKNFIKFNGTEAPSNAFENDIETFIRADRKELGKCSAISLFDTLLNFYSVIAEHLGKIEVFCDHFVITDYAEWLRAKEVKLTISKRTVQKTGETVGYEFEDKLKMIFDRKGNPLNVETSGISEKELKKGTELVKQMLFSK